MRRIAGALGIAAVLALGAPAVASAHHRHHHHRHHLRVRMERFGTLAGAPSAAPTSTAGTVASFEGGVLTLTLNDGSTVKGVVTPHTQIKCDSPLSAHASDHGSGSDEGQGGDDQPGANDVQSGGSEHSQENENEDQDEDDQGNAQPCGPASLVKGALVRSAELEITPFGAFFTEVELAQ